MNQDQPSWNERYLGDRFRQCDTPREFLMEQSAYLPQSGMAMDVATGLGGSAAYLMQRGLRVMGVDSSTIAIKRAHQCWPEIMFVLADLDAFHIPGGSFDVITNFYYFNRTVWRTYRNILKPGGILIIESLTQEIRKIKPEISPDRLLETGELSALFSDWNILVYREGWISTDHGTQKPVASLVARLP
jgi:tellurite methyltransferase